MKKNFLFISDKTPAHLELGEGDAFTVTCCLSLDAARAILMSRDIDCLFVDLRALGTKPLQTLDWLATFALPMSLGAVAAPDSGDAVFQAMKLGVTEFVSSEDFDGENFFKALARVVERIDNLRALSEIVFEDTLGTSRTLIIGDPATRALLESVRVRARLKLPLLMSGPEGVGKSLWLKYYLSQSTRVENPTIIEGIDVLAQTEREALIAKLSRDPSHVVIATTSSTSHDALPQLIGEKLAYYFAPHALKIPPLTRRGPDVIAYLHHFVRLKYPKTNRFFSKDFCEACLSYDWPQNVRELKEVTDAILSGSTKLEITARLLPQNIVAQSFYRDAGEEKDLADLDYNEAKKRMLNKFNHTYIAELLKKSDDNLTVAAERAGMDRSNFKKILRKYGFERHE